METKKSFLVTIRMVTFITLGQKLISFLGKLSAKMLNSNFL